MKLTSILTLNEGAYSKLADWEAAAKKLDYTVTKDNKSGTYHAWEGTTHKGRFTAPTGKGSLTEAIAKPRKPRIGSIAWELEQQRKKLASDPDEIKRIEKIGNSNHTTSSYHGGTAKITHKEGILNKIADKVMGKAPTNKYKVGDEVSYEMDPPQEGGRGRGKITSVSKAGDHYTVNGKFVNHFEINKKHTSTNEGTDSHLHKALDRALSKEKKASPAQVQRNKERWAQRQAEKGVKESAGEPSVDDILYYLTSGYRTLQKYADSYQDFSVITRIYDGLRMDLKEGNYIAFSQSYNSYLERYPDAAVELYDAMFEAAGLPPDEGTIEEFMRKCSGVMEGIGDTIKRGVKNVKRAAQGWGDQGMKNMTDKETPRDLVNRNKGYDDEKVKSLSKFRKAVDQERPTSAHSPQALQNRVLDREMKKRGLGEAAKSEDMTDCKCTKCKKGTYQETSQMDDADGVLHCTNCGMKVDRYKTVNEAYTGHFNDDDWYEVDPKTNTVLRHAGGHAAYRPTMSGQPIQLPNGNILMRGMRAKSLQDVTESASPFRKGDIVTIIADSKYKGEKCKVLSVDRGYEILEVTMINFPGSHIRSDWRNFSKVVKESADPQDAKSKWTVTYDTYGSNKTVPLEKGATKIVYADTADEACAEIKKLVGGRNHKAECIRKPISEQKVSTQPEYKSTKYKQYTIRQEGPTQWAIVGATVRRFGTLLAAKNYIDKRL